MKIKVKLDLSEVAYEGLLAEARARGIDLSTLIEDLLEVRAAQKPAAAELYPDMVEEKERLDVLEAIIQALIAPVDTEGEGEEQLPN